MLGSLIEILSDPTYLRYSTLQVLIVGGGGGGVETFFVTTKREGVEGLQKYMYWTYNFCLGEAMNSTDIADMSLPTSIPGGSPDILHRKVPSCLTNQLNLPAMMEENLSKLKTPLSLLPLQANQANSATFLQQLQHISPVDFQQLAYQTPSEHKLN